MKTTIVREFVVRNRNFTIVRNKDGFYCAIEDKYIDENGCLNTTLHGGQMHASKILSETLDQTQKAVEIDYLENIGYGKAEAFAEVMNMPLDIAKMLF